MINMRECGSRSLSWAALLFLVIAIWLPFGFSLSGLIEEWGTLSLFTEHGPVYFVTEHTQFAAHRLRPFTLLPQSIAYMLDSGSFIYWHVLQMLAIVLKGVGIASIVMWLSGDRRLSLVAGSLMIIYPADTMQLAFRSLHINWAVALTICSIALILSASENPDRFRKTIAAVVASILIACATLHYEAALFFIPFPLVLWWAKYGLKDGFHNLMRQPNVVMIWLFACIAIVSYLAVVSAAPDLYQASVSGSPFNTIKEMADKLPLLFKVGLYRLFVNGWFDGLRMFSKTLYLPYILTSLIVVATVFFLTPQRQRNGTQIPVSVTLRWLMAGIIAGILGYLPYLSSLSHIYITQRTYLFATIGAVIVFAGMLALAMRRFPRSSGALAIIMVCIGLHAQWVQFKHYDILSKRQKAVLASILEELPNAPAGKQILILDSSGITGNTWMLRGELMQSALTYLYGQQISVQICAGREDRLEWKSFNVQKTGALGTCKKIETGYEVGGQVLQKPMLFFHEDLVVLRLNPDGTVVTEHVKDKASTTLTQRWSGILGCWPSSTCRANSRSLPTNFFEYDFGKWWSLEDAQWGVGWRDAEWTLGLQPRSFSWKQNDFASLSFILRPDKSSYEIELKLLTWVSRDAHDSINVRINGHDVPVTWSTPHDLTGIVEYSWLNEGVNELSFISAVDASQGVDLAVDRVTVQPKTR